MASPRQYSAGQRPSMVRPSRPIYRKCRPGIGTGRQIVIRLAQRLAEFLEQLAAEKRRQEERQANSSPSRGPVGN